MNVGAVGVMRILIALHLIPWDGTKLRWILHHLCSKRQTGPATSRQAFGCLRLKCHQVLKKVDYDRDFIIDTNLMEIIDWKRH